MSLLEIMAVMAIMAVVLGIGAPSMAALLDVQQRGAARELAQTFRFLEDEAAMRNVTFRVAFNLDTNAYRIEVGDPNTLVFSDPEQRAEAEQERERAMRRFSRSGDKDGADAAAEGQGRFANLDVPGFASEIQLPEGTAFGWVWTPQYGEPQRAEADARRDDDEGPRVVYAYVFSTGEVEHTVVRIVDPDDAEDGYTVEVEPLSGAVSVVTEDVDPAARFAWLPEEGPTLR